MMPYYGELVGNTNLPDKSGMLIGRIVGYPKVFMFQVVLLPQLRMVLWDPHTITVAPDRRRNLALYCMFARNKA